MTVCFFRATRSPQDWNYGKPPPHGTEAGTVLIKDTNPGPSSGITDTLRPTGGRIPAEMICIAGKTLFFLPTRPDTGPELWKSDGTEAGTHS